MVQFSNGRNHSFGYSSYSMYHLKCDLQKVLIWNGQISDYFG